MASSDGGESRRRRRADSKTPHAYVAELLHLVRFLDGVRGFFLPLSVFFFRSSDGQDVLPRMVARGPALSPQSRLALALRAGV